jgi:hypothetical protein
LTATGRVIYGRRKETVERSFADAKQLHGHRYARMRGQLRVLEQCLLAAVCQNLKKMALLHEREENGDQKGLWRAFFDVINNLLSVPESLAVSA